MFGDLHLPSLQYWMATAARLQTCQANRHQLPRVSHLWDLAPGRLHLSDCTAPQPHLLIACCWCRASLETRRSNIFAKVLPDKRLLASTCLPTSGKVQLAVALARLRHSLAQLTAMLSRVDSVLSTGKRRQAFKADLFPNLLPGTGFEAPCTRTMKTVVRHRAALNRHENQRKYCDAQPPCLCKTCCQAGSSQCTPAKAEQVPLRQVWQEASGQ